MDHLEVPLSESLAGHVPVLLNEVAAYLAPQAGQVVVDATLGGGGHALAIAQRLGPRGTLIGIEQDEAMLAMARHRLSQLTEPPALHLIHDNFAHVRSILDALHTPRIDGLVADLGFASDQMSDPQKGLSFQVEGPLDMRLGQQSWETAADLLQTLSEAALADLFFHYGEERHSRRIARRIVAEREQKPLATTTQLAELVRRCVPGKGMRRIDPATRVFQALRIAVNRELDNLEALLQQLPAIMKPGGRVVIISFHSLEDRLVKQALKSNDKWQILTKKPITPSEAEIEVNPRSRSAKLRSAAWAGP